MADGESDAAKQAHDDVIKAGEVVVEAKEDQAVQTAKEADVVADELKEEKEDLKQDKDN